MYRDIPPNFSIQSKGRGMVTPKKVGRLGENNELDLLIIDHFNVTREEGIFPIRVFLG